MFRLVCDSLKQKVSLSKITVVINYTGETVIAREEGGFACPVRKIYLKNGSTLRAHLKRHDLKCEHIIDPTIDNTLITHGEEAPPNSPFSQLDLIAPLEDDRVIFDNIAISNNYYTFQREVKAKLLQNQHFTLEENVQHLLSLSFILLLKPGRTHTDLHQYISSKLCDRMLEYTQINNNIIGQSLSIETRDILKKIIDDLVEVSSYAFKIRKIL